MIWYAFSFAIILLALANANLSNSRNTLQAIELEKVNTVGLQLDELAINIRTTLNDTDSDGFVEPGLPVTPANLGTFWPGGGGHPPAGMLPDTDPWGTPLAYCAWDNGSVVDVVSVIGVLGRLAGAVDASRNAYAVISAGQNRKFETHCFDLETGAEGKGDDQVRAASQDTLVRGFGAKFWGDPVLNESLLPADDEEGAVRLNQTDGKLYRYYDATGWLKLPALQVYPEGTISRYGAEMNGGNPMTVSLSETHMAVIDGAGQVLYAGRPNGTSAQSLTLRPTGLTGKTVWTARTSYVVGGSSNYSGECPVILGLDGSVWRAPVPPCTPANYTQTTYASPVRKILQFDGQSQALLYENGYSNVGTSAGATVDAAYNSIPNAITNPIGVSWLDNENTLFTNGVGGLGQVRAYTVGVASGVGTGGTIRMTYSYYAIRASADGASTSLWVSGNDPQGQLGLGSTLALTSLPTLGRPWTQTALTGVRSVAATQGCGLVVKEDGTLWSAGTLCRYVSATTSWVQDATISGVEAVWVDRSGNNVAMAVKRTDGSYWVRGDNVWGQLGVGTLNNVTTWTRLPGI